MFHSFFTHHEGPIPGLLRFLQHNSLILLNFGFKFSRIRFLSYQKSVYIRKSSPKALARPTLAYCANTDANNPG